MYKKLKKAIDKLRDVLSSTTALACGLTMLHFVSIEVALAQELDGSIDPLASEVSSNSVQSAEAFAIESPQFSISVDGETVYGGDDKPKSKATKAPSPEELQQISAQRQADIDLASVDIQVKFDGLDVKPLLNVATSDLRHSYQAGQTIEFMVSSNYPGWIERSEVWIFEKGSEPRSDLYGCLLYTSPSPRDKRQSRMPSSA